MKKIAVVMVAFCLLSTSLFAQTNNVLSVDDAISLYEGKEGIELIRETLDRGVNATNSNGSTALIGACFYGYTDIVKSLIEEGADVNIKVDNMDISVLMLSPDIVKIIISNGANANIKGLYGSTALMSAAFNGHTDIVKILIEAETNLDIKEDGYGLTALMLATVNGHTQIVKALLEANANAIVKDNDGKTALMIASMNRHTEIIKLLEDAGATE